jgi:conjugative transfer region protein TrbK
MGRTDLFRALAIIVLIGAFIATLAAINRESERQVPLDTPMSSIPEDLSEELRRCRATGPQNREDPRCEEVWETNRRRFFGSRATSVPPKVTSSEPAPADPAMVNPKSINPKVVNPATIDPASGGAR